MSCLNQNIVLSPAIRFFRSPEGIKKTGKGIKANKRRYGKSICVKILKVPSIDRLLPYQGIS